MPNSSEIGAAFLSIARDAEQMAENMRTLAALFSESEATGEDGTGKKRRRQPKLVDPRQPEKAQSAYNHYIKDNYNRVRTSESSDNRGVMTELAKGWKAMSADEKKKYETMAVKDKERYEIELKEFESYRADHPFDPETEGLTASSKKQKRRLAEASKTGSSSAEDDEENGSEEDAQAQQAAAGSPAKAPKAVKKKTDKKTDKKTEKKTEKKAKASGDKAEQAKADQAKDGKKKRRNSKPKKPVTKGQ